MGADTSLRSYSRKPGLASSPPSQAERVIGERHWSNGTVKWVLPPWLAATLRSGSAPFLLRMHKPAAGRALLRLGPCSYAAISL